MKNLFLILALTFGVVSCTSLDEFFGPGTVFTTEDQVVEGGEYAVVPTGDLPDKIRNAVPEGAVVVLTGKEDVVEGGTTVPLGGELDDGAFQGVLNTAFAVGTAFIPGLAAWEGVLTLFSKRKRKHYVKAVKAVVPANGSIDLAEMVVSIVRAIGAGHTSESTAEMSDEEDQFDAEEA